MSTILHIVKPLTAFIPEVAAPQFPIQFNQRVKWTILCLFLLLVCCQVPLFGVRIQDGSDPFSFIRQIVASNRGTLMELGISPLLTASMIMQLFTGLGIIRVDRQVKEDVELSRRAEKLLAILITLAEAVVYIWGGMYGPVMELGIVRITLILGQLMIAGFVVMLLDEVLSKGYGLGSGISLFIATNVCENIFWKSFSPVTIQTQRGIEFEGAIINAFHVLLTKPLTQAISSAFFRSGFTNLLNILATFVVFLVVIWCQTLRVDLPIAVRGRRGVAGTHAIKLFYTSSIPIILLSSCVANLYFISRLLYRTFPDNIFISLLGSWEDMGGQSFPKGGIAYYLSPPSLVTIFYDPIHAFLYTIIILAACAALSTLWLEVSGSSAKHVYEQFKQYDREIAGFPGYATFKILNKYIPTAAAFGGIAVGLLTIFADLVGAIGSGTSLLVCANTIATYAEMLKTEKDVDE